MTIASDTLFFDIETLPTIDADLIADIEKEVTPPGSITKPESIEAWHVTKGAEARKEAVRKTSLDGGTGRLASLAWAWADGATGGRAGGGGGLVPQGWGNFPQGLRRPCGEMVGEVRLGDQAAFGRPGAL